MKKVLSIILCAVIAVFCLSFSVSAKAVKVKAPKIKSVTNTDIDRQKIKWTKVNGVKGYQLYCKAESGKYKKIKTIGKNTTSFTNKKLKAGKKYFYKVRAYKKVSGKTKYSKFSVQLGKKCTDYLVDLYSPYSTDRYSEYRNGSSFIMGGDKYSNGFTLGFCGSAIFNLKGRYNYIEVKIGCVDGETYHSITPDISFLSDDSIVSNFEIGKNDLPKTYRIKIDNANKLEISTKESELYKIGFANIKLYK